MPRLTDARSDRRIADPSSALQRGQFHGLADQVAAHARGALDAQRLIAALRQPEAPDDAVHACLRELLQRAEPGRLSGWCRQIQKALIAGGVR